MALTDYPKWVLDQKRPGTEIRFKDGRIRKQRRAERRAVLPKSQK